MGNVAKLFRGGHTEQVLPHRQRFDREGLRGRLLSSSYAPKPGEPRHDEMMAELDRLFDVNRDADGFVDLELSTHVFVGQLGPA
jgi:hypothetical protein